MYKRPNTTILARDVDGWPTVIQWRGEKFNAPTFEEVQEWFFDGICESLLGHRVELDGVDFEGSPSWVMAMELV